MIRAARSLSDPLRSEIPAEKPGAVVMGIDPGLASVGYGVLVFRNGQYFHLAHGCITTASNTPSALRLKTIFDSITRLIELYSPRAGGMEELYFFRNVSSALPVAEARGVIKLAFAHAGVPLAEFSPNAIKKAVTGSARADKASVQEMVRILLGLDSIPSPDHSADALAAA
ncbi:MAG TPA: crossover junction endodeoxyribonuclease RuvC, partial [Rectinemataceae bacterium]